MTISKYKMGKLEDLAINKYKIPSLILMENVAMSIFNEIKDYDSYTIVCGWGANGGDGLALSRHLLFNNKDVDIFIIGEVKNSDSKKNLEILESMGKNINYIKTDADINSLINSLEVNEITIDAIFGTGLNRAIDDFLVKVIKAINSHSNYTVSIDIPSGFNLETGKVVNACVVSNEIFSVFDIKENMNYYPFDSEIKIMYIGIPRYEI